MTYLLIGIGNAGGAILEPLLEYTEIKNANPIVIKSQPDADTANKIDAALKEVKNIKFAFLFAWFGDNSIIPQIAETLSGREIKVVFVGVLPAERREKREVLIDAYYAMENLTEHVNTFMLVDNQKIAHLPNYTDYFPRYNRYIASCLADLLIGTSQSESLPEEMQLSMDGALKALSFGDTPGYVALSRASELTKGLWGYIFPFLLHKPLDLGTLLHIAMDKLSVSNAPIGSDKSITAIQVPEYYIKNKKVDKGLIEEFMHAYSKESHMTVAITKRNIAAVTNLFTYKFDQLERLREIRRLAYE
ncbi:Cell division GTPase FtsZ [Methanophagales archaeon]|nr:Cell division GTPase FtsZ [Methanophagales archaeon]